MKRRLTLGAVLLITAIPLWCVRKPLRMQYQQTKGWSRNKLAQSLETTRWVKSPFMHSFLPDFAQLGRYRAANRTLPTLATGRVVFYGDSITDFWPTAYSAQFFPGKPYIGRGIAGQSTPQMVWRFQQDVIELHPAAVVIMPSANDVLFPQRYLTYQQTISNIQTMVEMAQQHRIRVILCSTMPVWHYPPPQQAVFTAKIKALNLWLREYAAEHHLTYVDYYDAMADKNGALVSSLSVDGVHPNATGYAIMHSLVQAAIDGSS